MTTAARPRREGLSIGAVLAQLRPEFPDVTISKIRFLESEGLLRPARADSGYRLFAASDVDRLRFVLSAQRDHYLPLKVIKERLESADGDRAGFGDGGVALTGEQVCARADVDRALFAELERQALVRADAAGHYGEDAVRVARVVRELTDFGVAPQRVRELMALSVTLHRLLVKAGLRGAFGT